MVDLSRSLLKDFADLTNDSSSDTKKSNYVRGTVKVSGDKKYVQIDGSTSLTPISEVVDVQVDDRVLVSIENHVATIIGNFTFPPSARKEQEAIDKAEDAKNTADSANDAASDASLLAQSAKDKAEEAQTTSSQASSLASEAKNTAEEAKTSADAASTAASEAKESAAGAATDAATARKDAADAQAAVADAKSEIATITKDVTTVKSDVAGALEELEAQAAETEAIKSTMETNYAKKTEVTTVETTLRSEITQKVGELQSTVEETYAAKSDLTAAEGRLQSQITQNAEGLASTVTKVEKVESDTAQAQADVAEALSKASSAQTAAADAQSKATAAQTAATEAKTNAANAQSKATAAQTTADAAQAKADAADKAVQSAQTDLNEAKQNLANVANRVDATEEEIAAAQAAVDAAQESVNQALADAATANYAADAAQKAADKAKEDALAAQTAADSAQAKADNAQTAADKAQADATQAQKDVAALTSRVTSAETKIDQNAEQISLTATKVEEIGNRKVVTATTPYFYLSTSSTELVGGEWVTTPPEWTQGTYYWQKVKTTYSDGTNSESDPVCVTGNTGPAGTPGKGIKSTEVTYQASTSGTTVPTGSWSDTIPSVAANQYLWTRTVTTYTDNSTTTAYSIGKMGANGATGAPGKDGEDGKGIESTKITYQAGNSGTTAPTGNWLDEIPTVSANQYLWTRTVITYTDGSTSTAYSVGKMGANGRPGEDGKGIKSTKVTYQASTSGTTAPKGEWLDTIPSVTANQYLWTRTVITYTDDSTSTAYSVGKMGANGATGAPGKDGNDGKGIESTTVTYQSSTSGTTVPIGTWSPTIPSVAANQYLWTRTVIKYTDDTSTTSYSIGKMGANGADGSPGKGISSITVEFYLSTSKTTQAGGAWSTTMPKWETGKYLWTRNKIVYSNPTSTAYTTPVCDSSWEAAKEVAEDLENNYYNKKETDAAIKVSADGITSTVKTTITEEIGKVEIGAKNLLLNTKSVMEYDSSKCNWTFGNQNSVQTNETDEETDSRHIVTIGDGNTNNGLGSAIKDIAFKQGETYTFSCDIKGTYGEDVDSFGGKIFYTNTSGSLWVSTGATSWKEVVSETEFKRANFTFVIPDNFDEDANRVIVNIYGQTMDIYVRRFKLEKGNKATDWTPAPEDMATSEEVKNAQSIANEANSTADNAITKVTTVESAIQQLSDSISMLVTDENGNSMMTQTSDGWTFNMGSINQTLNNAGQKLDEMAGDLGAIDSTIDNLESLANDLSQKTAYITMSTDESGSPCIELGKSDNPFKVRVTNTSVDFIDGTTKVAYISNQSLYIERAIIKDELQIGEGTGFVWKKRANGNMGLRWVGGN